MLFSWKIDQKKLFRNCITLKLFFDYFFFIRPTDPTFRGGGRRETKHFIGMALKNLKKCSSSIKKEKCTKIDN